jgi:hypothetical protein
MISGRQALGSIDQTLNQANEQIGRLQAEISDSSERLLAEKQAQADDYRNLARVRLDRLSGTDVIEHLEHAERQAVALLAQRSAALEALRQRVSTVAQEREEHEQERRRQAAQLDAAVAAVDEAEASTQARLDQDAAYRAQHERVDQAQRKARHAAEKAARSEDEREQKGSAYRDDPLFSYLWARSYGLPDYRAGGLTRWLDGKVARLIAYADARANFARLNEIPVRLREHAQQLESLADAEFDALRALDDRARTADGIPQLEERVAAEQKRLDAIDQQIARGEEGHRAMLAEQARYAAGDDDDMHRAVEFLANEFRRDEMIELRYDAVNTPYPEDDVIVSRMLQREDEQQRLQSSIDGLKGALDQQQARLVELEGLRAEFKRNRYDRAGSVFADDSLIPVLLGQFVAGLLDRRNLWKVLQEHQRYRPQRSNPDFGSGGFGRGTVWKGGLGDLGDIIGRLGRGGFGRRGGGGGGGGFRSGGGF